MFRIRFIFIQIRIRGNFNSVNLVFPIKYFAICNGFHINYVHYRIRNVTKNRRICRMNKVIKKKIFKKKIFLRTIYFMVLVSFWRYPDPDLYCLKQIRFRPNDTDPDLKHCKKFSLFKLKKFELVSRPIDSVHYL